ncbi:MAG: RdgB/HAM1 family non-canonical purine NTP pyrophosphatase [Actinomycetes bacterium]
MDEAKRVVLATRNLGKVKEFERMLHGADLNIHVLGLRDFPNMPDVEETGSTFAENALLKAHQISQYTGLPALADDSGLCVDALGGAPGIFSARWAGVHGDDRANLEKVIHQIREMQAPSLSARFRCAVALVLPSDHPSGAHEILREGEMVGELVLAPRGTNGFGYDPIFVPTGFTQTTAELPAEVKDRISHRGQALAAILPEVIRLI